MRRLQFSVSTDLLADVLKFPDHMKIHHITAGSIPEVCTFFVEDTSDQDVDDEVWHKADPSCLRVPERHEWHWNPR